MTWQTLDAKDWDEWISDEADQLDNAVLGDLIERFNLVPAFADQENLRGALHDGPLRVRGDFTQPRLLTAVRGNLTVSGKLSTQGVEGFDGNATLVVFGDLYCETLDNDWASLIIVTGNCTVRDWTFAAREDSSFVIGGDFTTSVFIGADIWASVGGRTRIDDGYGYTLGLNDTTPAGRPKGDWRAVAARLNLPADAQNDEQAFLKSLESRLLTTGSLEP